jgi:hypothetical protein
MPDAGSGDCDGCTMLIAVGGPGDCVCLGLDGAQCNGDQDCKSKDCYQYDLPQGWPGMCVTPQ